MAIRLDHGMDDLAEVHEINVTPFIDVMLVLLIIFMVAAPLATVDVAVDLPVSTADPQPRPDKPLFLTIKEDHSLTLGNDAVEEECSRLGTRCGFRQRQGSAHFPARRQASRLRRTDGADEQAARRRISEGRAGRARRGREPMTIAADGFDRPDRFGVVRWTGSLLIVLTLHAALMLIIMLRQVWIEPAGMPPATVVIDLASLPAAALPAHSAPRPPSCRSRPQPPEKEAEPLPSPEPEAPKLMPSPAPHPAVTLPAPQPPKPKAKVEVRAADDAPATAGAGGACSSAPPCRRRQRRQLPYRMTRRVRLQPPARVGRRSWWRGSRSINGIPASRRNSVSRGWSTSGLRSTGRVGSCLPKSTGVRVLSFWTTKFSP